MLWLIDRRGQRHDEGTGEPESLKGRIDFKAMGSRAFRETANTSKAKKQAAEARQRDRADADGAPATKRAKSNAGSSMMAARDVIAAADELEGMEYIPRTAETRETYQLILSAVHEAMGGEQPQDVIRGATDFVIVTLKDDSLKDFDKKKEINSAIPDLVSSTSTSPRTGWH